MCAPKCSSPAYHAASTTSPSILEPRFDRTQAPHCYSDSKKLWLPAQFSENLSWYPSDVFMIHLLLFFWMTTWSKLSLLARKTSSTPLRWHTINTIFYYWVSMTSILCKSVKCSEMQWPVFIFHSSWWCVCPGMDDWSMDRLIDFLLGPYLRQMEAPRLGVKAELHCQPTPQPQQRGIHCNCSPCHSSWQCQIPNTLSGARDQTQILVDTSHVHYLWATMGTPVLRFYCSFFSFSLDTGLLGWEFQTAGPPAYHSLGYSKFSFFSEDHPLWNQVCGLWISCLLTTNSSICWSWVAHADRPRKHPSCSLQTSAKGLSYENEQLKSQTLCLLQQHLQ